MSWLEISDRLIKWSFELEDFDIAYKPRTVVKDLTVAGFLTEFTY